MWITFSVSKQFAHIHCLKNLNLEYFCIFFFFLKDFNVCISHFKDTLLYIIGNLIKYIDQREKKEKTNLKILNFEFLPAV